MSHSKKVIGVQPFVDFNPDLDAPECKEGRLYWDDQDKTLAMCTDIEDTVQQVGQELFVRVRNNSGAQIDNGEVIYISGVLGNRPTIALAKADATATSKIIGVVTSDIANNADGYVTTFGLVRDFDTSSFSEGDELWLSETTAGGYTTTEPDYPNAKHLVGYVIRSHVTLGVILVTIDRSKNQLEFGDVVNGNYSEFESDGTLKFNGDATTWKDINIGAATLSGPPGLRPATDQFVDENGTNTGIYTLAYDVGEQLSGEFELQHDYKEGSDIYFHVHWQGTAAPTGTDNVQWQLIYTVGQKEQTLDATATITKETGIDTQYAFYSTEFDAIDGTNYKIGDQFVFTLGRIAASANEYSGLAYTATIGVHYETDTTGSREITTK